MSDREVTGEYLDELAAGLSRSWRDAPVIVIAVGPEHLARGRPARFETVGGSAGVEVRMAAALALHIITDAIAGYQAEAMNGTPPGPQLERLRAAAAALAPDAMVTERTRLDA
jgi:hypothetical protein